MGKTLIEAAAVGDIAAGAFTFTVTDPTLYKTAKIDGLQPGDAVNLLRGNYAGNGWEIVTNEGKQVQFNHLHQTATPLEVGTYSFEGNVQEAVTIWTEEI